VEGDKLEAFYVLAVTTGMRSGELIGLRWEDVDLEAGTLRVRRTVFNGRIEAPKSAKGKRSIKLSGVALRTLRNHPQAGEWVFCTRVGTIMSVHNVHRR
jgi:integrase